MFIPVVTGPMGALQFPHFTPLGPSLITANLKNFWELPRIAQTETLASAYQHLSALPAANPQLLESVGSLFQRLNDNGGRTDADSFIISRLINEWGTLKDSVPPTNPPRAASDRPKTDDFALAPRTPVPPMPTPPSPPRARRTDRRRPDRNDSIQYYTDGKGGLFPASWRYFADGTKAHLKAMVWTMTASEQRALLNDDEANAKFLVSALASVILDLKTSLTETGTRGAGQSGLASAPSVRSLIEIINNMTSFMTDGERSNPDLAGYFWQAYGVHSEVRMAVNRLTGMRSLLSSLEESDRSGLEDTLYALDTAFLAHIFEPLADAVSETGAEASSRDEAHGELVAVRLGELIVGAPRSLSRLSGAQQVQLSSIEGLLQSVARETRGGTPTPMIRAFLRKLLPSEILRLVPLMGLIREKNGA
jgi:hypothetical protein